MVDISSAATPKSDQLNADDLIAGPRTIRIRDVKLAASGEQRLSVYYDGDDNKPWKPCKSMMRVLMNFWGTESENYKGRWLTLFRDATAKWAGEAVGGIRISHMSGLQGPQQMSLTVTKGSRKPFTVKPLDNVDAPPMKTAPKKTPEERKEAARKAAENIAAELRAATDKGTVLDKHKDTIERLSAYPDLVALIKAAESPPDDAGDFGSDDTAPPDDAPTPAPTFSDAFIAACKALPTTHEAIKKAFPALAKTLTADEKTDLAAVAKGIVNVSEGRDYKHEVAAASLPMLAMARDIEGGTLGKVLAEKTE